MKKLLLSFVMAAVFAVTLFAFPACTDVSADKVNLVAITASEVGMRNDIDYYVVAEPAATTKVNAIPALGFSGDLQQLYGGSDGYPQAVIVVKEELLSSNVPSAFMSALEGSREWLLSENTSVESIVSAVQAHLPDDMAPVFNANNLTKSVIANCGISFSLASADKQEITSFMNRLNGVSETSFGTPEDGFFFDETANVPDVVYDGKISVYAPDGAPALGLAKLMAEEETFYNGQVEFNVVSADTIQTYVVGDMKADLCVLPVNLAVKLLGSGENYKLFGTLTHGNLYMVSNGKDEITPANIAELKGKTVGVVNLAQIPGLTLKLILKNNSIEYTELK